MYVPPPPPPPPSAFVRRAPLRTVTAASLLAMAATAPQASTSSAPPPPGVPFGFAGRVRDLLRPRSDPRAGFYFARGQRQRRRDRRRGGR